MRIFEPLVDPIRKGAPNTANPNHRSVLLMDPQVSYKRGTIETKDLAAGRSTVLFGNSRGGDGGQQFNMGQVWSGSGGVRLFP